MKPIQSVLIANRSEIAIRIMRAASEMRMRTVGIYSHEDRLSLHRFKADESYLVGEGKTPLQAYLDIDGILRVAKMASVDAIHPGYGFLSENPDFAQAVIDAGIVWVGPSPDVMRTLGNKVSARHAAIAAGVPVMPATPPLPQDIEECQRMATGIGYPVMLKASWGGGGRGMRVINGPHELPDALAAARREAKSAFGNDEVYFEKLVKNARHVEVQVVGDLHGQLVHLFERDCTVQRRNQKVVERAPAPYLSEEQRHNLCTSAVHLMQSVSYSHAGTVEFLMDAETEALYFIEVNPRIQVEHTVTELVTGIDIVKAQLRISQGGYIGVTEETGPRPPSGVPEQAAIQVRGAALQCRVTTEDPENNFLPDHGRLSAYRSAAGFGVRLDAGTAYGGAVISPFYDSLLVKVTAWAPTPAESIQRMDRALREFRIRGLTSNLQFLENVINHPSFVAGVVTTRFIDTTAELMEFTKRRDRASKLLSFMAEVIVNGNPEMAGRKSPELPLGKPAVPSVDLLSPLPRGSRDIFKELGAQHFSQWMLEQKRVLVTDTTLRDAHQSLLATRMRTADMLPIAPFYARELSQIFALECWGGATFDVAMRFLKEDPWQRLAQLRERAPNILFQMLLRGANGVGYTSYPDNVVRFFIKQAAAAGVDLFRVFDALNWVENMRVSIDAVLETGALCEGTICYTADLYDSSRSKYNLSYYVGIAHQLQKAGVQVLAIKDMAGVCRPNAAAALVKALKEETGLPIHFHTHDTSGISSASVLAAIEAGCDAVDGAIDSMSGLTSQPNLSSIAAALAHTERDSGLSASALQTASSYFEGVRKQYAPFESGMRAGTADVYRHEMPGGQYTNLREQARSLGLEASWSQISRAYTDVNRLFGDIVKVTPTSKVVGDLALMMVSNNLSPEQVLDPQYRMSFPESVVSLLKGELGFPPDGFPAALSRKVLGLAADELPPVVYRPGALLKDLDLESVRTGLECTLERSIDDQALASALMYPDVTMQFYQSQTTWGDMSVLPTSVFFYGMCQGEEITIDIETGKTLLVSFQGIQSDASGATVKVQFELNGQPRMVLVTKAGQTTLAQQRLADVGNAEHVAAPMPGAITVVAVSAGQKVTAGDVLFSLEAMKMETHVLAERDGVMAEVLVGLGEQVQAKALLAVYAHSMH